ncbi:hypothetical protein GCM10007160_41790 [Litchfieldella qijiaojingensis]|uniref:Preprotein translocase subunit SecB n=1 Tax=Litchfieldella qijiaojingensis TaxID=980347 RepID=A0ABQ2ZDE6_9GAMM|nr:hypothetical protein [Halomonas qijiaojingensis]GGY10230.1 hypothetical protein GCM10007160_41790 [Halomonas qijiaojingensis]
MDKQLIAEAAEKVEIVDIYLYSSAVNRHDEIHQDNIPEGMVQQDKLAVTVDLLEPVEPEEENADSLLRARIDYGVRFVLLPESGSESSVHVLAELTACFAATYRYRDGLSEAAISEFMRYNAVHNTWPFWREHALRMSAEARLPRPTIPLMKPVD